MSERTVKVKSFADVHRLLKEYLPPARSQRGAYTLERMAALMERLGNPQNSYKVIHVAGTSGKTSTCYYIAAMLKEAGQKTGLSVSPHVDEINERVQLDLEPLPEKKFCSEFAAFMDIVEKSGIKPTYFELLSAFAFWEFARADCDYAVIEVGLGGLLDATNVIGSKNKLAVITDIGLDHIEVLGKTVEEITAQKAGIIKPYNKVVCYEQGEPVMRILREVADQQQAELHEVWPLQASKLPQEMPLFQRRNWYLALHAYQNLADRDQLPDLDETQLSATSKTFIPARMERRSYHGKTLIMDGAHNAQKMDALVRSLKQAYPKQKFLVMVSFVTTKQSKLVDCLEVLLPICSSLMITTFTTENQERVSIDPLKVADTCEALGFEDWRIVNDPLEAFRELMEQAQDAAVVTGSFYLLNHIRPLLNS